MVSWLVWHEHGLCVRVCVCGVCAFLLFPHPTHKHTHAHVDMHDSPVDVALGMDKLHASCNVCQQRKLQVKPVRLQALRPRRNQIKHFAVVNIISTVSITIGILRAKG